MKWRKKNNALYRVVKKRVNNSTSPSQSQLNEEGWTKNFFHGMNKIDKYDFKLYYWTLQKIKHLHQSLKTNLVSGFITKTWMCIGKESVPEIQGNTNDFLK